MIKRVLKPRGYGSYDINLTKDILDHIEIIKKNNFKCFITSESYSTSCCSSSVTYYFYKCIAVKEWNIDNYGRNSTIWKLRRRIFPLRPGERSPSRLHRRLSRCYDSRSHSITFDCVLHVQQGFWWNGTVYSVGRDIAVRRTSYWFYGTSYGSHTKTGGKIISAVVVLVTEGWVNLV